MGNLSNPSINRWGLNLFWYRYWYTDKTSQLNIQQDDIFTQLLYTYLFYGISFSKNIFLNKYWYLNTFKKIILYNYTINYNEKYYRIVEIKKSLIDDSSLNKIRTKVKQVFYSRIWIFRFQKWIIFNFYNFQSLKKMKKVKQNYKDIIDFSTKINKNNLFIKKIKILLNFIIFNINITKTAYVF